MANQTEEQAAQPDLVRLKQIPAKDRKALMEADVPRPLRTLVAVANDIPVAVLRHALREREVSLPYSVPSEEAGRYLAATVTAKLLTPNEAERVVLAALEYGGKSVYPFTVSKQAIARFKVPPEASECQTASEFLHRHSRDHDGYRYFSRTADVLRVVASEKHVTHKWDAASGASKFESHRKTISFELHERTGIALLVMDRASGKSPHGVAQKYEKYWREELQARLGEVPAAISLVKAIRALQGTTGLVRMLHLERRTNDGQYTYAPLEGGDVRDTKGYLDSQASAVLDGATECLWLSSPRRNGDGRGRSEVLTSIYAHSGEVRFDRNATEAEVWYVIEQLRKGA